MERDFAETCDPNCANYGILCEVADELQQIETFATHERYDLTVKQQGRVACTGAGTFTDRSQIPMDTCGAQLVQRPKIYQTLKETDLFKAEIEVNVTGAEELIGSWERLSRNHRQVRIMPKR